jgi:glycosyltransferase involved in cell wall biosynthesis
LRIAQVAPLFESVPPKLYGGTERVVSWLTEELVRLGHEVTLFASGDSVTSAQLISPCARALRLGDLGGDPLLPQLLQLEQVARLSGDFDVVHYHLDYLHFSLARRLNVPHLTTLHGRLDRPGLAPLFEAFDEEPVVSISHAQREPLAWANWQRTVHHGLPLELHRPRFEPSRHLAFLGRASPEKGLDQAIEIARRAGLPIKIGAKVDPKDEAYFHRVIEPLLGPGVEFLGEIGGREKEALLGEALALVFPIDWPEPFGLVMIESMACGTPVIAYRRGSVPEILEDGLTGFIVDDLDGAVEAVGKVAQLSRRRCRRRFEERFAATRMAREYVHAYERLCRHHRARGNVVSAELVAPLEAPE